MTDVIYPAALASGAGLARLVAACAPRSCLALLCGLLLAAQAGAAMPFSFASAPGRLPKGVVPVDYTVAITPDAVARTLRGHESIVLDFREASAQLVFNSLNETLADVRLDGQPVALVDSNDEQQLTTVKLAAPAPAGRHTLSFDYTGKIETIPQGLFAQPYVAPGGGKGLLLSTQFESTDARRMFPCWDEPAFRASFELTVTVPAEWTAVSNMPIAHREAQGRLAAIRFERSPSMPSYLVHLTAGDLAAVTGHSGPTRLGVWAVRGQEKYGAVALANAVQILADYNDYFDYPYPLAKLDSIAVPGGYTGAMEDWGAISYNDQALLITPSSTVDDIQKVYSYQAHEMAHQWHGDLVTMAWWDDVWLNESFASWRGAAQADARHPDWHWWEGQDEVKEQAMRADARVSSHAIEQPVTNELEATNVFDPDITYNKGQAVLRMLEAHLGADHFRDGVRRLMKAHAYSNASSEDLWAALAAASGRDVSVIARSWTEQPGFPVVHVAARCDAQGLRTLTLSQRRFLLRGEDKAGTRWMIPLEIRSGASGDALPELLVRDGQTVAAGSCDEPLTVNANAVGYYRAEYDDATLAATTRGFASLPAGDRIALLDDQWALVESGAAPLPTYLRLASAMGSDLNERAWNQVVGALNTIEYAERGGPGHDAFVDYAQSLLRPVFGKLGWDGRPGEAPGTQRLRRTMIGSLGLWGDKDIIAEARRRFALFIKDRSMLKPDEQAVVLTVVARNADAATFRQLHAVAKSAANETELRRYYTALMQVRDPALADSAATIALSAEIPPQADSLRLWLVLALSDEHQRLAWNLFVKHLDALLAPHQPYGPLYVAQYGPGEFWSSVPLEQLEAWVKANVPTEMTADVARGMETARFKIAEKSALVQAADRYLALRANPTSALRLSGGG